MASYIRKHHLSLSSQKLSSYRQKLFPLHVPIERITRRFYRKRKGPPKIVTAEEAVAEIQSHARIYVHSAAATPLTLLDALSKRHAELRGVEFYHLHLEKANPCSNPEFKDSFFTNNFFIGSNQRKNMDLGVSSYIPAFLQDVPKLMRKNLIQPDWALLNVSPPDRHGFCSLGVEVCAALPAAQTAKKVIAQINPNMPKTHGYCEIHYDAFDFVVPNVNEPLPVMKASNPSPVEERIGTIIAGLVSDGATLQMGIGSIPDAVLKQLHHHKNLGIHTEMFSDGAIDLIEKGIITNLEKKFLKGKTLTSFVMGSQRVYDFINDNVSIVFMDASITNNPRIIAQNPKVTAINSAIEVDITGQVCADSIGTKMISGVGGQIDFERGAALSEGGLPIICLPSTTKSGESRIVPMLKPGAGVITTRYHVHYVVTEYGYAYLHGKNLMERAKAMIEIAHPNHREQLKKEAFERYKIAAWR